ncbi:DMT family transporter [Clostridium felsineum]|uniref:Uncharacterized protein n=1 Tax=Clostridium felsineum TaxID=36839 RepID=A0A1S8L5Q8_9CLOT|nr:DMT family transporter [Clostridium felsineum]MCR3757439.1 DMT family transporter [Clostridium felsineum]URZ03014.1 hypothetical protein CLAUR_030600 [Clostridium felsineum]URZ08651.1 hypothetical protein CLROS_040330 [Clostridium felsineum]URZ13681.1 hypothetical protein CROST_044470 [Clostridium felsineum]URZ14366.1 hypothetical protein CLFE_003630 [Clostridium felsineum DSM 794]
MIGIICSIISGICMSLQGIFNTRLSEKIGLWETNAWVQGTALLVTLVICLIYGNGNFKQIMTANKLYLTGGILGAAIIFTVMMGVSSLGPTYSISVILVAQLLSAALIDLLGLFDTDKITFGTTKIIGVILMLAGIIFFKIKG